MKSWSLSVVLSVFLFSQTFASSFCTKLVDARCGEFHTLALDTHGNLWSCGGKNGVYILLGIGNISGNVPSLQRVKGLGGNGFLKNIIAFDAGWYHSLAVDADGNCYSFGYDYNGQLGNGPYEGSSNVPTRVHGLNNDANGLKNIVMVSAGRSGKHSLAARAAEYL